MGYFNEAVEKFKSLTSLELPDIDYAAKLQMAISCKTEEILDLEGKLTDIKNRYIVQVEKEHNEAAKGSDLSKSLANAELREIEVRNRLKDNRDFKDTAGRLRQLKLESRLMQLTVDSTIRKHELRVRGLDEV